MTPPVALAIFRPTLGRTVVVGKLVQVDGELVLAVPFRHRRRLQNQVSLPKVAVDYALGRGARFIIIRYDSERVAYRLPLQDALRLGAPGHVDGAAEIWLALGLFEETAWPDWDYAVKTIRLGPGPGEVPRQLALPLAG